MNWKTATFMLLVALLASVLIAFPVRNEPEDGERSRKVTTATTKKRRPTAGKVAWSNWRDVTESGFPVSTPEVVDDPFPERVPRARAKLEADLIGLDVVFGKRKVREKAGHER